MGLLSLSQRLHHGVGVGLLHALYSLRSNARFVHSCLPPQVGSGHADNLSFFNSLQRKIHHWLHEY